MRDEFRDIVRGWGDIDVESVGDRQRLYDMWARLTRYVAARMSKDAPPSPGEGAICDAIFRMYIEACARDGSDNDG